MTTDIVFPELNRAPPWSSVLEAQNLPLCPFTACDAWQSLIGGCLLLFPLVRINPIVVHWYSDYGQSYISTVFTVFLRSFVFLVGSYFVFL